jgi:Transglycosylase SLT domain
MKPEIGYSVRGLLANASCVGAALALILGLEAPGSSVAAQANRPSRVTATSGLDRGGAAALDRIAFAVDDLESAHGTDPRMWGPNPDGPQGPMQMSAAAAEDVGGGDRFDERQNRALGRAYLALMYRRYGSWPDAIAAYNWGPGNMDSWISGGRVFDKLPPAVERYRMRVLLGSFPAAPRLGIGQRHFKRASADPHQGRVAVERLYVEIMRAADLHLRDRLKPLAHEAE